MVSENLLYLLITANCPLKCSFCMTKHLHRNQDLDINEKTLKSIFNLSLLSKKVCISGEGDPLAAWQSIGEIIRNGPRKTHYELITSAYWAESRVKRLLLELDQICHSKNSSLAFRISIDEFHDKETTRDPLKIALSIFIKNNLKHSSLEIRSVTGQENYVFNRISDILDSFGNSYSIVQKSDMAYFLQFKDFPVKVQFKPTVFPERFDYHDDWNLMKYVRYIESYKECEFHLGLLNDDLINPIFDVAVNPNGDIVLYGLETYVLGNINEEIFTYNLIKERVSNSKELKFLNSTRLLDLLNEWSDIEELDIVLKSVDNPYWIVRYFNELRPIDFRKYLKSKI